MCVQYLGYDLSAVDYALVRWSVGASMIKINETLQTLYGIRNKFPQYDYTTGQLDLAGYIDILHQFCDDCLDQFDLTQMEFADLIAGN